MAHRIARVEPGSSTPPVGGKTARAEAPATTARVRAARRARDGPGKKEARSTTTEGQQERTAASTPGAQPTRTEPPAERTVETTGATGNGEPCREPAKATAPPRGNGEEGAGCYAARDHVLPAWGRKGAGGGDVKGQGTAGMEAP